MAATADWDRRGNRLRRTQNVGALAKGLEKELYRPRAAPKPKSFCGGKLDPKLGLKDPKFHDCLERLPASAGGLMTYQSTVQETARTLALTSPNKLAGHRGLLVYHTTGSGKTVSSLAICLAYMRTNRFVAVVTTPSNLKDNSAKHYLSLLKYFPTGPADILNITPAEAKKQQQRDPEGFAARVAAQFTQRVSFSSYWRFASCLGVGSAPTKECGSPGGIAKTWKQKGLAVILDEAHAIASPGRGENPEKSRKLREFFLENSQTEKLHLYALTATPGDTPEQWATLLSMVRNVGQPAFTASSLDQAQALVSHADPSGNVTRVAVRRDPPIQKVSMDAAYFTSLLFLLSTMKSPGAIKQLGHSPPEEFLAKIRAASLVMGPSARAWMGPAGARWVPEGGQAVATRSFKNLVASPKLVKVLQNVVGGPGKQYLYVPEEGTPRVATVVAAMLEKAGWTDVSDRAAKGTFDVESADTVGKNFIVYRATGRTETELARMRAAFNGLKTSPGGKAGEVRVEAYTPESAARNIQGQRIKIVVASGGFYQGFNVAALRGVHLPCPFPTKKQERQAEGRGARLDAHKFLPEADRTVAVHRYVDTLPAEITRGGLLESLPPKKKALATSVQKSLDWMDTEHGAPGLRSFNALLYKKASGGRANGAEDPMNRLERQMKNAAVDCLDLRKLHPGTKCAQVKAVQMLQNKMAAPGTSNAAKARILKALNAWKTRLASSRRPASAKRATRPAGLCSA